jgi:hypothetical protein
VLLLLLLLYQLRTGAQVLACTWNVNENKPSRPGLELWLGKRVKDAQLVLIGLQVGLLLGLLTVLSKQSYSARRPAHWRSAPATRLGVCSGFGCCAQICTLKTVRLCMHACLQVLCLVLCQIVHACMHACMSPGALLGVVPDCARMHVTRC